MDKHNQQNEAQEFDKFMRELIKKAAELQKDYSELSAANQQRVYTELTNSLMTIGVKNALEQLSKRYGIWKDVYLCPTLVS